MTRKALLVVEGQHDEAFIARLLRSRYGFEGKGKLPDVDPFWVPTIPRHFPYDDDLRRRVPVPYFYSTLTVSLALVVAVGDSNLVETTIDTLQIVGASEVSAVGVVLDADDRRSVEDRFTSVKTALNRAGITTSDRPGKVHEDAQRRIGIYVLPDNSSPGTLEEILLECAEIEYSAALNSARSFVTGVNASDYHKDDLRELRKPSGNAKAVIASITAILKPGKTTQASISDNRWISDRSCQSTRIVAFERFLQELLELPDTPSKQSESNNGSGLGLPPESKPTQRTGATGYTAKWCSLLKSYLTKT